MAQPLEDPSPSPHYAPCAMVPSFPPPFGLAAALTSPRLPMPSPTPPPPPPHLGACAPHPMMMLQWIRSLLVQACPSSCTPPNTAISAPPPPPPPPVQPFCTASEAVQLAGLLSAAKPTALPQSSAPPPPLDPFLHEPLEWRQANQEESEQLRRFRQALCTGSLDPQTMKIYQNFRYSLKISNHGTARRKNTTRETTGLLKAWLNEHRKNPYPNKSEKIMLAVITKMSLTQVSTWFANARRRLKKENKATWSMTLDPHFPDADEGFPGPVGGDFRESETYPTISPPPPSQIPSPPASYAEEVAACGKEMKKEAVTATKIKRSGKIWSVVEMTEGG